MFEYRHYVPILKGKRGEFKALSRLRSILLFSLTPFIDITRPDKKLKGQEDKYFAEKARQIHDELGTFVPMFVDCNDINLDLRIPSGNHYVSCLFEELRSHGIITTPVTGLERDQDYNNAVKDVIVKDNRGVCLRLFRADVENLKLTQSSINELLSFFGLSPSNTDLLLDFRHLAANEKSRCVEDLIRFLLSLDNIREWRSLILAGSAFPENMGGVEKNSSKLIPRLELHLWEEAIVKGGLAGVKRFPSFGDYGICHPDMVDYDKSYNPSARIRYTLQRHWLVVKGQGVKRRTKGRTEFDYSQYFGLAAKVFENDNYCGPHYSYGDSYIYKCAHGKDGPGGLEKWIEADTNHHLTFVSQQIANHVVT